MSDFFLIRFIVDRDSPYFCISYVFSFEAGTFSSRTFMASYSTRVFFLFKNSVTDDALWLIY